ncbi:MAG: YihY/virulence factor BrkB family protein [Bacteroidota bacterium]
MKSKLLTFFKRIPLLQSIYSFVKSIKLPGFQGLPLFDVLTFFFQRFSESELQTRARAIAFSLFLALFPTIIFLFTLIPYVPLENFQIQVLLMLKNLLPASTYDVAYTTIEDIVSHQRGGLLSFGFFFALFVSADGISNIMKWFNKSFHGTHQRSPFKQKIIAICITISLAFLMFVAITLSIVNEYAISFLVKHHLLTNSIQYYLLQFLKWMILLCLCFSGIALLYYFGPSERKKISFLTPGACFSTFLVVLTSLGFNFFINNFARYNKIYGSIGTLIIILIWTYLNSLVLLIGYELNISINEANTSHKKKGHTFKK